MQGAGLPDMLIARQSTRANLSGLRGMKSDPASAGEQIVDLDPGLIEYRLVADPRPGIIA